jgi:hypothetical protein
MDAGPLPQAVRIASVLGVADSRALLRGSREILSVEDHGEIDRLSRFNLDRMARADLESISADAGASR